MAAGFRSPLALWAGGAGASTAEQGSVRSLLAPWVGGASAPSGEPPIATAGFRGLLAPWIGGASAGAALAPTSAGIRSLLAFWIGGAAAARRSAPVPGGGHRKPHRGPVPISWLPLVEVVPIELHAIGIGSEEAVGLPAILSTRTRVRRRTEEAQLLGLPSDTVPHSQLVARQPGK